MKIYYIPRRRKAQVLGLESILSVHLERNRRTVRNIVQLGMGGPPFEATAEEKPAQAVTSQASTNPKSTYDNYRLLLRKTCRWRLSGPAQYDHCVRRRQGLQCVFHQPAASAKGRHFFLSLSLSLSLPSIGCGGGVWQTSTIPLVWLMPKIIR